MTCHTPGITHLAMPQSKLAAAIRNTEMHRMILLSEKMWGDLRGGKKSVGELKGVPQEITVTLSNPGLALKRQQSWEQVKESAAKNVSHVVWVKRFVGDGQLVEQTAAAARPPKKKDRGCSQAATKKTAAAARPQHKRLRLQLGRNETPLDSICMQTRAHTFFCNIGCRRACMLSTVCN